jgi:hypothetical protein
VVIIFGAFAPLCNVIFGRKVLRAARIWVRKFGKIHTLFALNRLPRRIQMRKAMLFLALLGFASLLWAQDPSLGTWKLNLTKSKIPSQNAANLKESVIVMRAIDANTYESISTDTTKDGKTSVTKWTVPITGGIQ